MRHLKFYFPLLLLVLGLWNKSHAATTTPTLVSPSNNTTQWAGLTLDWNAVSSVHGYQVQWDTLPDFSSAVQRKVTKLYINTSSSNTDTEQLLTNLYFGKIYYWRVRAYVTADTSAWSQMRLFSTRNYVTTTSPASNTTQYSAVYLDWDAHHYVSAYDWELDTLPNFSSNAKRQGSTNYVGTSSTNTDTQVWTNNLFFGKTYYWRVRARNTVDTTAWVETRFFKVTNALNLTSPSNGTTQYSGLYLDWYSSYYVTAYQWQLDTSASFNSPLLRTGENLYTNTFSDNPDTYTLQKNLLFGQKYYWRVRARNTVDTTEWSSVWYFTTTNTLSLTSPSNGTTQYSGLYL
ncbi:hypothetical protein SAMN05421780_102107, partial [Flexibacter flexilis DSM 6793]